ncbi:MAG TPA: LTA synthase family protein [Vicinamibacterales bacterium]
MSHSTIRSRDYLAKLLAAVALLASAGGVLSCRRVPPPPYALAFGLDGAAPRVLETSREVAIPLTIVNVGQRQWDPATIHLSYHWLWLVPRETVARSRWDVPYHNGIRTDLPERMPPGSRAAVWGRLLPPSWPGLYWLQWDMVEEGAAWFAQAAPRQSRVLVVVLPPIAWILAPIPLLVALLGLRATRRPRRRFGETADIAWCLAALLCKPLMVVHEALLEPTGGGYRLTLLAAVVPPILGFLMLPRRVRAWTLVAIGLLGSLVVLSDIIYYRFFGDVLSAPALLGIGQTGRVWASIRSLFSPALLWTVIDCPFAIWLASRVARAPAPAPGLLRRVGSIPGIASALAVVGLAMAPPRAAAASALDQMFRDRSVVEQLGLFGFHAYDGWNYVRSTWLRPEATDAEVRDALAWFVARAPMRSGPASSTFGAARGRNVIVIQVESLQDFVVDFRVGDQEVMPHLKRWVGDSLRFTNVTDETSEGRTSDAEFTTMTSLLPLDHGAVAFRYPGHHYTALPRILAEQHYHTLSAVPFEPGFWNRRVMHPAYGFEQSLFEPDFDLTEQIGWGLNDRDFLKQMLPRLEHQSQPFAAWLITLSLHHPFDDFPARHKVLRLGSYERTSFGNYLHTMRFFDDALDAFMSGLAADGLLHSSVVVVFGDHDAGFAPDAALAKAIGLQGGEAAWAANDRVPLFIRVPASSSRAGELVGARDIPAGQTDLAPTLLSLLGIDAAGLPYIGRNLLAPAAEGPVVRPFGEWIDRSLFYFARGSGHSCFDAGGHAIADSECASSDHDARRTREISRLVVAADLQSRLRDHLAPDGKER